MRTIKIVITLIVISLLFSNVLSQNPNNNRIKTKTVRHDDNSLIPMPLDNSERIKFKLKIEKDSVFYSLKAVVIEKSVLSEGLSDDIISKRKVFKGDELIFEMVPDITKSNTMTLFIYLPGMTAFKYLFCEDNKQIKYNKFTFVNQSKNSQIPLLLCYVDDEQNRTEKLLEKYLKDHLITITTYEELKEKILNNIDNYMFVYHNLSDK